MAWLIERFMFFYFKTEVGMYIFSSSSRHTLSILVIRSQWDKIQF